MRRRWKIIGLTVVGLFLGGAVFFDWAGNRIQILTDESAAFAGQTVRALAKDWDDAVLVERAAPELLSRFPEQDRKTVVFQMRGLGHLTGDAGFRGAAHVNINNFHTVNISAQQVARATFENGYATITFGLVKLDGQWRVMGMHTDVHVEPNPAKPQGT